MKDAPFPAEGEVLIPHMTKMNGEAIVDLGGLYIVCHSGHLTSLKDIPRGVVRSQSFNALTAMAVLCL